MFLVCNMTEPSKDWKLKEICSCGWISRSYTSRVYYCDFCGYWEPSSYSSQIFSLKKFWFVCCLLKLLVLEGWLQKYGCANASFLLGFVLANVYVCELRSVSVKCSVFLITVTKTIFFSWNTEIYFWERRFPVILACTMIAIKLSRTYWWRYVSRNPLIKDL